MKTAVLALLFLATATIAIPAAGFEIATHAAITREAYRQSAIGADDSVILMRIGIHKAANDLGKAYFDIGDNEIKVRLTDPDGRGFVKSTIAAANARVIGPKPVLPSVVGWIMMGAIREDDVPLDAKSLDNNPVDEPGNPFPRVLNHFYDPSNGRPLTVGGVQGAPAPQWGFDGNGASAGLAEGRRNHYSWLKAREAMWKALTMKQWPPVGAELVDHPFQQSSVVATSEEYRRALWATAFRCIGDVLHLLQDMAQPQHTRNDAHAGLGCRSGECLAGHASYFEKYVDARIKKERTFRLRERFLRTSDPADVDIAVDPIDVIFDGYPIPRLGTVLSYFSSGVGSASSSGKGLSDYSNRGFYSMGTNINSTAAREFIAPPPAPGSLQFFDLPAGTVTNAAGLLVVGGGKLRIFTGTVEDHQDPAMTTTNIKLSSQGAFDPYLTARAAEARFALTYHNYQDQARLLIPRAVAYSAGLIDYFFRGRMEIRLPGEGVYALVDHQEAGCKDNCGFKDLKLILKNKTNAGTDDKPIKEAMSAGTLAAVIQFHRNSCYTDPALAGDPGGSAFTGNTCRSAHEEIVVSDPVSLQKLEYDEEKIIRFKFRKPIPINASDVVLQVVFRGKLGEELDAVAVETKDISEPNHLAVANSTDAVYDDAGDGKYHAVPFSDIIGPAILNTLKVTFGTAGPVVACLDRLDGAEHAQIAFLTDRGSFTGRTLVANWETVGNPVVELIWDESRSQFRRTAPFVSSRGWNRDTLLALTWTTLGGTKTTSMACMPGDGGICNDASLSPLQETKMKRWSLTTDFGGAGCAS